MSAPPSTTAPSGSSYNTVVITGGGNLTASGLMILPGGGQTGISASASGPSTAAGFLTDTTVNLGSGGGVKGITANGSGASVTLGAGSSVIARPGGGGNVGILITNGATVNLIDGAFVNMPGGGGSSQVQATTGGVFDMTGGSLTVSGAGGNGIRAGDDSGNSGTIRLTGTTIEVLGTTGGSAGIWANNAGSTATLTDVVIAVDGNSGGNFGVRATNGAGIDLIGGAVTLTTNGGNNIGVQATGAGTVATLTGTSVTVSNGSSSIGAQVTGADLVATDSDMVVNGANGTGLQISNAGTASFTGGSMTTTGAGGQAIYAFGSGPNNATFDGTAVSSTNGYGILAMNGMSATFDFTNGASLVGGNGTLLLNQTTAGSIVNLNATNQVNLEGDVNSTGSSGLTNVTLADQSTLTGGINVNSLTGAVGINPAQPPTGLPPQNVNVTLDSSSVWNMTASSTVNTLNMDTGSMVHFIHSSLTSPFTTLAVNNLTGTGGVFGMDVDLAADQGDLLTIQATSTGDHLLDIFNRSAAADLPSDTALLVVRTPGGSASFAGETDGGTYKYYVVHGDGSSVTPNPNDWYLVRGDEVNPGEVTPVPPIGPAPPEPPSIPGPLPPIADLTNTANAAIGTSSAVLSLFYGDINPVIEQMQDLRVKCNGPEGEAERTGPLQDEVWMKGFGSDSRIDNEASRVFDQDLGGFQIGADHHFKIGSDDFYAGGFAGYFHGWRDFLDGGSGDTDAFSIGLYGEWIHPCGWYANLVLKHTYLWNSFSTPTDDGFGPMATASSSMPTFGGLLEIGKRCDIGPAFIEPQARLEGAWADGVSYTASDGLAVRQSEDSSLRGSLGLRFGWHFEDGPETVFEPYARVAVTNEFLGRDEIETDTTTFDANLGGAGIEASTGVSVQVSRSLDVYSEYQYFDSDRVSSPWAIDAGVRVLW